MKFRRSLRHRLIAAFCLFAAALSILYGLSVYATLRLVENRLLSEQLKEEVATYKLRYESAPSTPPPASRRMTSFWGETALPQELTQNVDFRRQDGYHELRDLNLLIAVQSFRDSSEKLFIVFDTANLETEGGKEAMLISALIGSALLVTLIGFVVGGLLARTAIAPVVRLADKVKALTPQTLNGNLPTVEFAHEFHDDEIGILANTLQSSLQRIGAFVEREQRFTRDASHELRTPIAVIQGAVELQLRICARRLKLFYGLVESQMKEKILYRLQFCH